MSTKIDIFSDATAKQIAENLKLQTEGLKQWTEQLLNSVGGLSNLSESLRQEIETRQNELAIERERIDQIIQTNTGVSTNENAELIDIRIGVDGETYETAGEAIRDQFNSVYDITEQLHGQIEDLFIGLEDKATKKEIVTQVNELLSENGIQSNMLLSTPMYSFIESKKEAFCMCAYGKYLYIAGIHGFQKWDMSIEIEPKLVKENIPWGNTRRRRVYGIEYVNGYILASVRTTTVGYLDTSKESKAPNEKSDTCIGHFYILNANDLSVVFDKEYCYEGEGEGTQISETNTYNNLIDTRNTAFWTKNGARTFISNKISADNLKELSFGGLTDSGNKIYAVNIQAYNSNDEKLATYSKAISSTWSSNAKTLPDGTSYIIFQIGIEQADDAFTVEALCNSAPKLYLCEKRVLENEFGYENITITTNHTVNAGIAKPSGLIVSDKHKLAIVTCQLYGFEIFDISDIENPISKYRYVPTKNLIEYQSGDIYTDTNGNIMFICAGYDDGFHLWNITNVENPTQIINQSKYDTAFQHKLFYPKAHVFDIKVRYPYAYATLAPLTANAKDEDRASGLLVLNLTNTSDLTYKYIAIPKKDYNNYLNGGDVKPCHMSFIGFNKIALNNGDKGLAIYEINNDTAIYRGCIPCEDTEVQSLCYTKDGRTFVGDALHIDNAKYYERVFRGI